jgi:hypothetical protein
MMTLSKTLVARFALGLVALTGVVSAVPASARPYEARSYEAHIGWGGQRGYDDGYRYHRDWREMRHHHRVIAWRDGYYRW